MNEEVLREILAELKALRNHLDNVFPTPPVLTKEEAEARLVEWMSAMNKARADMRVQLSAAPPEQKEAE